MKQSITRHALLVGVAMLISFAPITDALAKKPSPSNSGKTAMAKVAAKPKPSKPTASKRRFPDKTISLIPPETSSPAPALPSTPPLGLDPQVPNFLNPPENQPKQVLVPPDTVLIVTLDQELHSKKNQMGDAVSATVSETLFLGPYEVIPKGSHLSGKITQINPKRDAEGRNPYIVVAFEDLKRPLETTAYPAHAALVAYKSGLRGQDYVWKLPSPAERKRSSFRGIVGGAISGAFFNPVFGPLAGAGLGFMKGSLMNNMARGGDVSIKPQQPIPIAIDQAFMLPVSEGAQQPAPAEAPVSPQSAITGESFAAKNAEWQRTLAPLLGIAGSASL